MKSVVLECRYPWELRVLNTILSKWSPVILRKGAKITYSYRIKDLEDGFLLRITQNTIELLEFQEIKRKIRVDQVKIDLIWSKIALIPRQRRHLTGRNREVVDFTRYRVKNNTELTNLMKMNRIQGYNGKYGSNPQGIKQFLDAIFNFDQIGREIDGRNWGKWYFKKVEFKSIPRNQKSSNLDLISRRNKDSKWSENSEDRNRDFELNPMKLISKS